MRNDKSKWNFIRKHNAEGGYIMPTLDGVVLDFVTSVQVKDGVEEVGTMTITVQLGVEPNEQDN